MRASSGRVEAASRMVAHTPPNMSQSSADIPIVFADSADVTMATSSDEWDQTTAPMMEVPSSDELPEEDISPYDDPSEQSETVRVDSREVNIPAKKPPKEDADEPTDRMNAADIQHIVDAVREARDRDRKRRGG